MYSKTLLTLLNKIDTPVSTGYLCYAKPNITDINGDKITVEDFKKIIISIMDDQHTLNIKLCGDKYTDTLKALNGREIRYGNCLISEGNELLDSTVWKHWKSGGSRDEDNMETELVDLGHFYSSALLVYLHSNDNLNRFDKNGFNDIVCSEIWNTMQNISMIGVDRLMTEAISMASIVGGMLNLATTYNNLIPVNNNDLDLTIEDHILKMICVGYAITLSAFMLLGKDIYGYNAMYKVKNALNIFRADNGYNEKGESKYVKLWYGLEDNYYAKKFMEENKTASLDALIVHLHKKYTEFLNEDKAQQVNKVAKGDKDEQ